MKKIILIITLFLCMGLPHAHAEFRALLVGINYQNADPNISRLYGCILLF